MLRDWSDAYRVGIDEIDEQHQGFFAAAHRLYEAILDQKGRDAVGEVLAFMRGYAEQHFETEEAFMRRHDYPGLREHQRIHAQFFQRLEDLEQDLSMIGPSQDLADRALDITQDWLIDHIGDEDMLYALHVKAS